MAVASTFDTTGTFIVPGDDQTYLIHCDLAQHMEKGMKGQLKVGGGDGDLWAVPGVSSGFLRADYLPPGYRDWLLLAFTLVPVTVIAWAWRVSGRK